MKTQNKKDLTAAKPHNKKRLSGFLISVLIMTVWIAGMYWLFLNFMPKTYFVWYLENGTMISIATSFMALVWNGLDEQKGLLSWHPGYFLVSCFRLLSMFFSVMAANLAGPLDGIKNRANETVSIFEVLWDGIFTFVMHLLMAIIVLGWLLIISPLFYLVTLFTGAPARRSIRDTGLKVLIKEGDFETVTKEQESSKKISKGWVDISFETKPFALTNALNAAVLFIVKTIIDFS